MPKKKVLIVVKDEAQLTPKQRSAIRKEQAELEGYGVTVKQISMANADDIPKYYIDFPPEKPMFQSRLVLEGEGWDVGQSMGRNLSFYASKRLVKSKGWAV